MNISFQEMVDLASHGLISSGISKRAAVQTAQFLALAECDGIASHGLARVAQYVSHAKNNRIALKAEPQLLKRNQAVALIDAGDGLAFPALRYATDLSVELAHRFGIGLVAITNSHHFGVAGHFTEASARAGYISIMFGNTPAAMPMVGGKKAIFGTNPIAASFPVHSKDPLVIDMSLSAVARGKILVAAKKGESIPQGWALDASGQPTTDAQVALQGLMVPLGGDKGALLALVVELLVVGLTGSRFSYEADSFFSAHGNRPQVGQLIITIKPDLAGKNIFNRRLAEFLAVLSLDSDIRLPGQRRFKQRLLAMKNGVEVSELLISEIQNSMK